MNNLESSPLAARLKKEFQGDVLFDTFTRGRYSTDASIYQVMPLGVVVPKSETDVQIALQIAREEGIPVLPRGGGTSQNGQTVNEALVIDTSKHLRKIIDIDAGKLTACVQPGLVLDQLNKQLKQYGLWYPVDVSTANRATLGGMTGNNSCGSRSIRYGNMVHNVHAIEALLPDGSPATFGPTSADNDLTFGKAKSLVEQMLALGTREADEIDARFPKLLRRVGGYNINELTLKNPNLARLLVGSEGTLAWFQRIHLDLSPIPAHRTLGVCHFPTFYQAMEATQQLVKLDPSAVELVDRTMINLARDIPMFKSTVDQFVQGEPEALLLVEFSGEDQQTQLDNLRRLVELMADLGFPGALVEATNPEFQSAIWEVRKQGLNIMMSMKGDGKPVSFIEDCAVELTDLAEYTQRLTDIFHKHGTTGTFYAHASVGTLHVRPILNMKEENGAHKMRAIAEECFEMVREYKGSHSGEHGDGLSRSEFHTAMFGQRMVNNFEEVKDAFDPKGLFNPGRIVQAPKFDDRSLFRYPPGYDTNMIDTAMDWSEHGGIQRAAEMCNNNGACRKIEGGTMCPSYRATQDEQHLTRGRANTLRLALSGQLGKDALLSDEMANTMSLCVSCKACKRECPTGVDMAKMKIEFLHQYYQNKSLPLKERFIAWLPRYAPVAKNFGFLLNLRDQIPGLPTLSEWLLGFTRHRPLPKWRRDVFGHHKEIKTQAASSEQKAVVLLVDTFNTYFEPENARAALTVLEAAGYQLHIPTPSDNPRPLCCGRTFLNAGLTDQAKEEMTRTIDTLKPFVDKGTPIIGLEPSCLLTLRDEFKSLLPGEESQKLSECAMLFEEFLAREHRSGNLHLTLNPIAPKKALLHGHCHQKAFGMMSDVETVLSLIPELEVETIDSGCCGMAGSFGYDAEHYEVSMAMGELSLLPKVRDTEKDDLIIADGTSCRSQIREGASQQSNHVAQVLESSL
ncbi:MAG: FAD-linked oxidase C-terminal domain-containing protein [Gammaproteobacteria bacterium]|nr:FAD-linked oxidase C-terminal domain-containing protein [Gammaproteobacteria bacterium]